MEILVTCGVFVVLIGGLLAAFSTGSMTVSRGMEALDTISTTGLALAHLKHDLRRLAGPIPVPEYVTPEEFSVNFLRLEAVDEKSGEARLVPVRYDFQRTRDRRRSSLVREEASRKSRFGYDRDVVFGISPDERALRPDRCIEMTFTFPSGSERDSTRPRVRSTVQVLNSSEDLSVRPVSGGGAQVARVQLLPRPDRPFRCDGSRFAMELAELLPAELLSDNRR